MRFELVVFDTKSEADDYNEIADNSTLGVYVGQMITGIQRNGNRPSVLTRKHSPLTAEKDVQWNAKVLMSNFFNPIRRR